METETTPLAARVPRTPRVLWSNTKMRKRCGSCRPLRADPSTPARLFLCAGNLAVRPYAKHRRVLASRWRRRNPVTLGPGPDSQGKTRSQTIEDSDDSIWDHRTVLRTWHHTCLTVVFMAPCLSHNDHEVQPHLSQVFTRRRRITHGVCGIRSPGCGLNVVACERPFPERWPPGACNPCSCK
jgi:hypothetical protein